MRINSIPCLPFKWNRRILKRLQYSAAFVHWSPKMNMIFPVLIIYDDWSKHNYIQFCLNFTYNQYIFQFLKFFAKKRAKKTFFSAKYSLLKKWGFVVVGTFVHTTRFQKHCGTILYFVCLPKTDIIENLCKIKNKEFLTMAKFGDFFLTNWEGAKTIAYVGTHFDTLFTMYVL